MGEHAQKANAIILNVLTENAVNARVSDFRSIGVILPDTIVDEMRKAARERITQYFANYANYRGPTPHPLQDCQVHLASLFPLPVLVSRGNSTKNSMCKAG